MQKLMYDAFWNYKSTTNESLLIIFNVSNWYKNALQAKVLVCILFCFKSSS